MKETKKVFIPLTLDNSTKTLFSGKQLIGFAIFILLFIFLQVAMLSLRESVFRKQDQIYFIIGIDIVCTYFLIFLLRKIVLRENEMIKQYQANQNLQKTDISFCWDIYSIREGRIYYCNGTQGILVRLAHGYLLDRPPDQEKMHRELVNLALGNLAKQGYRFIYFNREVRDSNLDPLRVTERNLFKYKDTTIYGPASKIIQHTYKICQTIANTEQEYYLILADNMDAMRKLDYVAKEFIRNLHGGIYVKLDILKDEEIWDFIADLYGISYIDTSALLSKKFEDIDVQLVQVIDVSRENTKQDATPIQSTSDTSYDPNWDFMYEAQQSENTTSGDDDIIL